MIPWTLIIVGTMCVLFGVLGLISLVVLPLYRKLFPDRITVQTWDEINEAGQFVTEDGKAYTYYILVSGDEVSLSGLPCADMEDLEKRLSEVKRENTVIIYDSFAVSSTYREVKKILNKMGFDYEETR